MNKKMLLGALALSSLLLADGEIAATSKMKKKDTNKMMQEQPMPPAIVTLTSARPESDNGWYLFADVTYWHADIGSTDWAIKSDLTATPNQIDVHSLNFKWNWGFKVGIGANMDHDKWDTNFYYTWFSTHNSNSAGDPSPVQVSDNISAPDATPWKSASIHWNIHYSMFDWELGRWGYVSKELALRPHVGLKGGWINQDVKVRGIEINTFTGGKTKVRLENDFWGVGPCAGINTMWVLGNAGARKEHRFSLFGDVGGALMYGHFDVDHHSEGVLNFRMKGLDRNLLTTMLQGQMGLMWDVDFNHNKNHFTLKVGYDMQYWFRQNQLVQIPEGASVSVIRISDDLALQGVTGEFRFDF